MQAQQSRLLAALALVCWLAAAVHAGRVPLQLPVPAAESASLPSTTECRGLGQECFSDSKCCGGEHSPGKPAGWQ